MATSKTRRSPAELLADARFLPAVRTIAELCVGRVHVGTPMREVGMLGFKRGLRVIGRRTAPKTRDEARVVGAFVREYRRAHARNFLTYARVMGGSFSTRRDRR